MLRFLTTVTLGVLLAATVGYSAIAQEVKFFTLGTGGTAYTFYPVGGVIANAISKPPGPGNAARVEAAVWTG